MGAEMQEEAASFDINLNQLHEEWRGQAQRVYNAGSHAAACEKTYAEAKAAFKKKSAQLRNDIRTHPSQYGLDKATEAAVNDAAAADVEYLRAEQKMIDAQYAMDLAFLASTTLEHRKKALEKIVDLWLRSYFSEPIPRGRSEDATQFDRDTTRERLRQRTEEP